MKTNITKYTMGLALTALLTTAVQATAADGSAANPALSVLSAVTISDLPAKASDLIQQASPTSRQQMTIDVVKAAIGLDSASAPAIVSAIAKSFPDLADVAAATAAALVPDQADIIARAAATAAPSMAGQIVKAICVVLPKDYKAVAEAVAEVVPGAAKEILAGVYAAIPSLKNSIESLMASYNGNIPSVIDILNQVQPNQEKPSIKLAMLPNTDKSAFDAPIVLTPSGYAMAQTPGGTTSTLDNTPPATGGSSTPTQ